MPWGDKTGWEAVPLNGPVHGVVADDHGGRPVEDLGAEAAPGVEDGVVGGAGEGVLAVGGDAVGDDALLLHAACGRGERQTEVR